VVYCRRVPTSLCTRRNIRLSPKWSPCRMLWTFSTTWRPSSGETDTYPAHARPRPTALESKSCSLRQRGPAPRHPAIKSSPWATCLFLCISICLSVQSTNGTPGIGSRTWATMANKWVARAPRVSAHYEDKYSEDLPARPDQIHPDLRAAQREAVEMNACVSVIEIVSNREKSGRPRFPASSAA